MIFYLLVDYDNLGYREKSLPLLALAEKLIGKFTKSEVPSKNVTLRIYGGWYENNNITHSAQALKAQIHNSFPRTVLLADNQTRVIASVELALALNSLPKISIFNTYRRRGFPSGLNAHDPKLKGCTITPCPTSEVYTFLSSKKCSSCGTMKPEHIFFRQEQKLVDTMLIADMFSIGQLEKTLSIVSSDDDFWPGILSSTTSGVKIIHIHTKQKSTSSLYTKYVSGNYFQKNL